MLNITLLNELQTVNKITMSKYGEVPQIFEAKSAIDIFITTTDYLDKQFEELKLLASHPNTSNIVLPMHEKIQKCQKILQEFQIGFSIPHHHAAYNEIEKLYKRFLFMDNMLELFYITSQYTYLQQTQQQLLIISQIFKDVANRLNANLNSK